MKIALYYIQFAWIPVIYILDVMTHIILVIKMPIFNVIDAYKEHKRNRPF